MRIDSSLIKSERKSRAWSQEHLAQVTGLGLRTIQRVESNNTASPTSVTAICTALDLDVTELLVSEPTKDTTFFTGGASKTLVGFVCASLVSLGAFFLGTQSFADQIMLDVAIAMNGEQEETGSLLTQSGKQAEMRLDNQIKLVVAPVLKEDGRVFLYTEVFEYRSGDYVLLGKPNLLTKNNIEAEIRMTLKSGGKVSFRVTPRIN